MRTRATIVFFSLFTAVLLTSVAHAGTPGSLSVIGRGGKFTSECPLRHTDVKAAISGSFSRVTVTQQFENTASDKIEAVYTFPLPHDAAVDDMTIRIGERTIRGVIQTREQARKIYEKAIQRGQTTALLDQERPNIFTQRVGNIPGGASVEVVISYIAPLKYEDGTYEFSFPTVVGPRYIPGDYAIGSSGGGFSPDTNQVPDASKVTPPVSPTRAGHDISISVAIDAGVAIQNIRSKTHHVDVRHDVMDEAVVRLRDEVTIPNKDFILRYDVAGSQITEGILTHTRKAGDGYFSLIIQPPARFNESDVTPKEIVFVLDSSGSMGGFPIERAQQFIDTALDGLYAGDTFNVIKFSGETAILFKEPVYPTAENIERARQFTNMQWGGGGTEMMKAIRAALDPSDSQDHLRIVVFLTDGYVGNDLEILGEIRKHSNARVFAYGIGTSVNRFLIEGMGREGRGDAAVITSMMKPAEVDAAAKRLYQHLRSPLLTDISLDFGGLPVTNVHPARIADLFSGRPVVVTGRYSGAATGTVTIRGKRAGDAYVRKIPVSLPASDSTNAVLAALWARARIEDLMSQDLGGLQRQQMKPELQKEITQLGLSYRLMTQFTSFVAVEERVSTEVGKPRTVQVPVELPSGVQYEEGWNDHDKLNAPMAVRVSRGVVGSSSQAVTVTAAAPPINSTGSGGGVGGSSFGGVAGGIVAGSGGGAYRVGGGVGGNPKVPTKTKYRTDAEALLASKSDTKLLAAYRCWTGLADKSAAEKTCKLSGDTVHLDVILGGDPSALVALGFKSDGALKHGKLRGTITLEKLTQLAALKEVRFMSIAK